MTKSDGSEVRRLSRILEQFDKQTKPGSVEREALRKAGFALHLCFIDGRRKELELLYENPPLTKAERERARKMGTDVDA
jgi:hypothetical protein